MIFIICNEVYTLERLELDVNVVRMLAPYAHDEVLSTDIQSALEQALVYEIDFEKSH